MSLLHSICFLLATDICIAKTNIIIIKNYNKDIATKTVITVQNIINAQLTKVWEYWTKTEHITQWNSASDDWHTPWAKNDIRAGGSFTSRMEAKDGSVGFEFGGIHDDVKEKDYIKSTLGDGRKMEVNFTADGNTTKVVESFEAETENTEELQRSGWQAILDNFKKYAENN